MASNIAFTGSDDAAKAACPRNAGRDHRGSGSQLYGHPFGLGGGHSSFCWIPWNSGVNFVDEVSQRDDQANGLRPNHPLLYWLMSTVLAGYRTPQPHTSHCRLNRVPGLSVRDSWPIPGDDDSNPAMKSSEAARSPIVRHWLTLNGRPPADGRGKHRHYRSFQHNPKNDTGRFAMD
jgi:hypothetical protein